jgi:hypothetical protein
MSNVFAPGTRVRLKTDLTILNCDVVPAGVTGVVVVATAEQYAVRLDQRFPALDAWGNEVRLYLGDALEDGLEALAWLLFDADEREGRSGS